MKTTFVKWHFHRKRDFFCGCVQIQCLVWKFSKDMSWKSTIQNPHCRGFWGQRGRDHPFPPLIPLICVLSPLSMTSLKQKSQIAQLAESTLEISTGKYAMDFASCGIHSHLGCAVRLPPLWPLDMRGVSLQLLAVIPFSKTISPLHKFFDVLQTLKLTLQFRNLQWLRNMDWDLLMPLRRDTTPRDYCQENIHSNQAKRPLVTFHYQMGGGTLL